jgi:SAM-dependent methyltransferase
MELATALKLIEQGVDKNSTRQTWADLGAGSGLFTQSVALLLPTGSVVHAVDKQGTVKKIKLSKGDVQIVAHQKDFVKDALDFENLDGIVMANSLHYVDDKISFVTQLKKSLKANGRLIIVEYDMNLSNTWVPYPIPFADLSALSLKCGFSSMRKLYEVPSVYHRAMICSALLIA